MIQSPCRTTTSLKADNFTRPHLVHASPGHSCQSGRPLADRLECARRAFFHHFAVNHRRFLALFAHLSLLPAAQLGNPDAPPRALPAHGVIANNSRQLVVVKVSSSFSSRLFLILLAYQIALAMLIHPREPGIRITLHAVNAGADIQFEFAVQRTFTRRLIDSSNGPLSWDSFRSSNLNSGRRRIATHVLPICPISSNKNNGLRTPALEHLLKSISLRSQ